MEETVVQENAVTVEAVEVAVSTPWDMPPVVEITIPRGKPTVIRFQFPTDEQWIARQKARRLIQRPGKQGFESEGGEEFDRHLLVELGAPDDITAREASRILNLASKTEVTDLITGADGYTLSVVLPNREEVQVEMAMPTLDQVETYRAKAIKIRTLQRGGAEVVTNTVAAGELFDTLCKTPEAQSLPIICKTPILAEVITEIDRMLEPDRPQR